MKMERESHLVLQAVNTIIETVRNDLKEGWAYETKAQLEQLYNWLEPARQEDAKLVAVILEYLEAYLDKRNDGVKGQ